MTLLTKTNSMRILGIDPGLAQTGWGVVDIIDQRYRPVSFGVVTTATSQDLGLRIHYIASNIGRLAAEHEVVMVAMEDVFFTKNISSAIPVAKVIGAIMHQLAGQGLDVKMFSPPQIKTAVTGYGSAEKHQVQEMMRLMLDLKEIPKPNHSADALAVAVCCASYSSTERRLGG
ncbi:crossover junction endodeoxyribonuclease RuvC [Parasphaerochaeta coccoides]|nr:crossover junction endodeoxyribonuclease RuvC [Parasphaerochaeta coccoides]